tara:strand:+ start:22 stop:381 length:360 start_codon:yes stop_codon:yes gene_type:complete
MKHIPDLKEYHLINGIVKVKISDLKTDHLYNIIMLWKRKAKGGTIWLAPPMDDGNGNFSEDHTEFYLDGRATLTRINLRSYIVEYNKRGVGFIDYSSICKYVGGNGTMRQEFVDEYNYA